VISYAAVVLHIVVSHYYGISYSFQRVAGRGSYVTDWTYASFLSSPSLWYGYGILSQTYCFFVVTFSCTVVEICTWPCSTWDVIYYKVVVWSPHSKIVNCSRVQNN